MSSGYRHKTNEPYADFIIRERGPAGYGNLTVEVDSTYNEDFVSELKKKLPHRLGRAWEPELKRWFVDPLYLKGACEIAIKHFRHVYVTEGETITDIVNGSSWEQSGLFT